MNLPSVIPVKTELHSAGVFLVFVVVVVVVFVFVVFVVFIIGAATVLQKGSKNCERRD